MNLKLREIFEALALGAVLELETDTYNEVVGGEDCEKTISSFVVVIGDYLVVKEQQNEIVRTLKAYKCSNKMKAVKAFKEIMQMYDFKLSDVYQYWCDRLSIE